MHPKSKASRRRNCRPDRRGNSDAYREWDFVPMGDDQGEVGCRVIEGVRS
jgi:hypothetical protein